ncbi:MAG TPA: nitroreductase/quinone reductase family protein, partial [Acidimicrobiales bacterium]|nr:nitroreductase/quinone reductase family protein [Acidimicrobiales bacterium]
VNALVYAQRGADYLLVASNGGRDSPPGWLFNLRAEPSVELQVARKRVAGKASVLEATDAGYAGLWNLVNENNHNRYRTYQQRTSRPIPIVVVHPDRAGDVAD